MPRVIAADGLRVPREDKPRTFIGHEPVDVADIPYYRRRLASGELKLANEACESGETASAKLIGSKKA